jgi:hypothetical protein
MPVSAKNVCLLSPALMLSPALLCSLRGPRQPAPLARSPAFKLKLLIQQISVDGAFDRSVQADVGVRP